MKQITDDKAAAIQMNAGRTSVLLPSPKEASACNGLDLLSAAGE
jgi:hypothetical protein